MQLMILIRLDLDSKINYEDKKVSTFMKQNLHYQEKPLRLIRNSNDENLDIQLYRH